MEENESVRSLIGESFRQEQADDGSLGGENQQSNLCEE